MAIKLSANYSKKLGLPQCSSHSFSASVEVELSDINQVEAEVQKLYQLPQHSVDQEIQHPGFVPASNNNGNGHAAPQTNGRTYPVNGNNRPTPPPVTDRWNCTDGQRGFILRIVSENASITKQVAEDLSQQLFGIGVKRRADVMAQMPTRGPTRCLPCSIGRQPVCRRSLNYNLDF